MSGRERRLWGGTGRGAVSALAALVGRGVHTSGAIVLAYHDVADGASADGASAAEFTVSPARLRAQLESALGWGLRFVDADSLVDDLRAGRAVDGLAAITFDDGLVGVHEHALAVLRDLGLPATAFVVGAGWGERPEWSPRDRRTMTLPELRDLVAAGVRIGSHGVSHRSLPQLDPVGVGRELADSRASLEELSGVPVDLLAYPFGDHSAAVRVAAADAGYRAAFGFANGRVVTGSDVYALPRLCMSGRQRRARLAYHLARPPGSWPPDPNAGDSAGVAASVSSSYS